MKVVPVPVREDNYAYLLVDDKTNKAAAVDPYDVSKVVSAADGLGVSIVATITTHHHFDHSGGNDVRIYASQPFSSLTNVPRILCLATPCHTKDSICYYVIDPTDASHPGGVFTGDTLFIGGCGRFFEGTADEMNRALKYLGSLPDKTIVYNGHEYTKGNLAFGKSIEPNSAGTARLSDLVKDNDVTTGKTTIGDEKEWNVFMRLDSQVVKEKTNAGPNTPEADIMNLLRDQKNNYRG
ncbi:Hydroxyacylglutathione hydrolase, mitochondrial [Leucoagaricus sp. SymC.cos]|nr:Hydroxyacylglutathione hydrolase, mitochondrial [Leucoagaricus sp. SymC.cos]